MKWRGITMSNRRVILIFAGIILFLTGPAAFAQKPKAGEPAPEIALEKVISPSSVAVPTLAALRGKVVFLEFWGVWCGHCIENIPHLNELASKFGPRGVEFLSISNDREKTLRSFLEETKISGIVALDIDSSVIDRYEIKGFPTTYIIGRNGRILAETHPAYVTEETLEDALAGRPLRLKEEKAEVSEKPTPKMLFEVWVRPAGSDRMMGGRSPFRIDALALPAKSCLVWAFNVPESRIILETSLPDEKYDMKAEGVPGDKHTLPALQLALASIMEISFFRETMEVEAYVLALIPGLNHKLEKPGLERPGGSPDPVRGKVSGDNIGLDLLQGFLDDYAGVPVIDETGLKENYTYDFKAVGKDYESLRKAVREQLGLDLRKEFRKLEVIVVRKG
jgi:uncharacterized protein (TIGR03435 family)